MNPTQAAEAPVQLVLVEDNPKDVDLLKHALARSKVTNPLVVLRDGAEALDYFFKGPGASDSAPTVVLLDLGLPKISGLEVLERLRADPRTRTLPIVVLTSSREENDLQKAYARGANAFVQKPVEFDQFVQAAATLGLFWTVYNKLPPTEVA